MNTLPIMLPRGVALVAVIATVLLVLLAAPASAHVDLTSSDPANGEVVDDPPETITLVFSTEAEPAGEGVLLVDAAGTPLAAEVDYASPDRVVVTPAHHLGNGSYGVVWTMRAGDAHPRSGSIAFGVDALIPAPGGSVSSGGERRIEVAPIEAATVGPKNTPAGDWLGAFGRWAALLGALVGIGAFAFAATSLSGSKREVEEAGYWVRRAGVLVIIGTVLELAGASIVLQGSALGGLAPQALWETSASTFGFAVLLRLVGGVAIVRGTGLLVAEAGAPESNPNATPVAAGSPAAATMVRRRPVETIYRLDLRGSLPALVGVAAVAFSYLFDGHTVTASPAMLARIATLAHVLGAGVWVGGVLLMGQILTRRWKAGVPLDAAPLAIRFSRVASIALVVVGAAGLALAWSILDSPGEVVSTAWGRLLLFKLAAVAVAAGLGAYNHFAVVPALEAVEHDEAAAGRLRRTIRIEGAVLLVVVLVTAILVGAAS